MLEVRPSGGDFVVFDTEVDEPIMRFTDRREADRLVAELVIKDVYAQLLRWSPDRVPSVY